MKPRRTSLFMLAAGLLGTLCALQLLALWRAPEAWFPASVAVTLKPGEAIVLGQRELAAPQADISHLALRRDDDGRWWARNASAGKLVVLERDSGERRMGSTALRADQQFRLGGALFQVDTASDRKIEFSQDGRRWSYDGATLLRNGSPQAPCPEARLATRALAWWNRWAPRALTLARPLTFGGNLYCDNRLGIDYVAFGSATLARSKGQLLLSSSAGGAERTPLMLGAGAVAADLAQREEALADVNALIVGHTRLPLQIDGDRLTLSPSRHVALFPEARVQLPPQVEWRWQRRALWALPAGAAWWIALGLCGALAAAGAAAWQRGTWPFVREAGMRLRAAAAGSALLAIAGIASLVLQRGGTPPGAGISILLGCGALWACLALPGRLTLVTAAGVLLLAIGLLAQLELGLGAMESSWLRHFQKTVALLAVGLGVGAHLRLRGRAGAPMPQTRLEWLLAALAGAALLALLLQVLFGDETGVFDLQPVEFAKLALTALTAHCIAVGMGWHGALPERTRPMLRWFRLAAPALLFIALLGLALVQVDDYSPLILLLVWSMVMAFSYSVAARKHLATAALLCVGCAAAAGVAWLRLTGVDGIAQWGFYADRFLVWLDPAQHPHTGQQLLLGARAIAEGAWWGSDRLLGLSTLGQAAGDALRVPAVQDDFAPSFFMNRHGLAGALILWSLQALFLVGLLQTAARAYLASRDARDFRHAWLGRFRCFALCGGAAFVLGHFLLSWGTNLAIFPIMGQPMSFLSAGGSHLLFFICPLLAFSAISAQSLEENRSCRSTSNTKF